MTEHETITNLPLACGCKWITKYCDEHHWKINAKALQERHQEDERVRIAKLIRALVGRDHCKACELRWSAGNRHHCRRCRTSYALAYAIEADAVAEHMLRQGGAKNGQNDA